MEPTQVTSKITGGATELLFTGEILGRYDIKFYRCCETGFIQTEHPYWLDEAYSDVIANADTGLLSRCLAFRTIVGLLIRGNFGAGSEFLDYGGGYGTFTRLMRDLGHKFFHNDPMCENLFSREFEGNLDRRYSMITAFEVFEHLVDPRDVLESLLDHTDTVFFSTVLQPSPQPQSIEDWGYFLPETGQHVSFYNMASLKYLAKKNGCLLQSNGSGLHAITRRKLDFSPASKGILSRLRRAAFRALH